MNTAVEVSPLVKNMLKVSLRPDIAINVGSGTFEVWVEFETHTEIENPTLTQDTTVFSETLGQTMTDTSIVIPCADLSSPLVLSTTCTLIKGNKATKTPAIVRVPITANVAADAWIVFLINDVTNPSIVSQRSVLNTKIMKKCRDDGMFCPIFTFSVFYSTASTTSFSYTDDSSRMLTFVSDQNVDASGVTMQIPIYFPSGGPLTSNDIIRIIFPENFIIPAACTCVALCS